MPLTSAIASKSAQLQKAQARTIEVCSGMPARLYVIDRSGKIAYKSGRGPFGFRVGEMEQALAMALLEEQES